MYAIEDEVTAWCFDRAVHRFGSRVDAELSEAGKGAKDKAQARSRQDRVLAKWLGKQQKFKDPVAGIPGAVSSQGAGPVQL